MARKNTRKSRNRKNRKTMKGGANNASATAPPANNASTAVPPANNAAAAPAANNQTGGRRRSHGRKMSSGAAKWRDHMMKVYREMKSRNPATKLGDAMRAAKKTYSS